MSDDQVEMLVGAAIAVGSFCIGYIMGYVMSRIPR